MEKRLEKLLTDSFMSTRATYLNAPDAQFVHSIPLPASTFNRAGTGVMTRVVIIDKVKCGNNGTGQPSSAMPMPTDVQNGDVNKLFAYIMDMSVPPRAERQAGAVEAPPRMRRLQCSTHMGAWSQTPHRPYLRPRATSWKLTPQWPRSPRWRQGAGGRLRARFSAGQVRRRIHLKASRRAG